MSTTPRAIFRTARALVEGWWTAEPMPRLRLLGVAIGGLEAAESSQSELYASPDPCAIDRMADRINARFGGGTVARAGALRARSVR